MDLTSDLRRELESAATRQAFLERLLRFGTARGRCPNGAVYLKRGDRYHRSAACGKGAGLPDAVPGLLPTARNVRNILLPGEEPARPLAFLRLEWDGPGIHDLEAVEALEAACVEATEILRRLDG